MAASEIGEGANGGINKRSSRDYSFSPEARHRLYCLGMAKFAPGQIPDLGNSADSCLISMVTASDIGEGANGGINKRTSRDSSLGSEACRRFYRFRLALFPPWEMQDLGCAADLS